MNKRGWIFRLVILAALLTMSCNLIHRLPGSVNINSPTTEAKSNPIEPLPSIVPARPTAEEQKSIVPLSQGPLFAIFEKSPARQRH